MTARARPGAYARLVLRITDARTGELVDATPARRGLTRVEARTHGFDPTNLRVLLVADLLVRALELGGTPVWALLDGERDLPELRAAGAALGVRPFEDGRDVGTGLGEAQVLHVVREGGETPEGVRVAVAPVHREGPGDDAPDGTDNGATGPAGLTAPHHPAEPAVLRLALLARPRSSPLRLGPAALDEAADTLGRWRGAVAGWAHRPSRPIPDTVRADLRAAWEDDLDVVGVLRVLHAVERDPEVPDGARFETYAYADRLLGLDLTRDLGSPA
ncbi:hypothetical protein [Streptomyces prasinopilosus]|uniref:Cysteinyl-tRNA synthetase n=1 Tax=Streptomyces prasinopilosus TaxID=67344 RepID=A0A1G6RY93_9ACTN|nr:hypothetical protein [Streptomyces prasinopilosus]SDD09549.1 hypothetical protein SAMN05216505_10570 [Streptomyces prasinopilosus]